MRKRFCVWAGVVTCIVLILGCSSYAPTRYCTDVGDCLAGEACSSGICSDPNDNGGGTGWVEPCVDACESSGGLPLLPRSLKSSSPSKKVLYFKKVSKAASLKKLKRLTPEQIMVLRQLFLDKSIKNEQWVALRMTFLSTPHLKAFLESRLRVLDQTTSLLKLKASVNPAAFFQTTVSFNGFFDRPEGRCTPFLQLRADRIVIHEADDPGSYGKDEVYCIFQAISDVESQYLMTPVSPSIGDGGTHYFPRGQSWIWGKEGVMYYPGQRLTVQISCIEDDSDARQYGKILEEINKYVGVAERLFERTQYGALLKTTSLILEVVSSLLGANDDDHLLSATVDIDEGNLAEFKFHDIEIRKSGESGCVPVFGCAFDWDWALFIHSEYCRE